MSECECTSSFFFVFVFVLLKQNKGAYPAARVAVTKTNLCLVEPSLGQFWVQLCKVHADPAHKLGDSTSVIAFAANCSRDGTTKPEEACKAGRMRVSKQVVGEGKRHACQARQLAQSTAVRHARTHARTHTHKNCSKTRMHTHTHKKNTHLESATPRVNWDFLPPPCVWYCPSKQNEAKQLISATNDSKVQSERPKKGREKTSSCFH